jgi:hypothetical protein
MSDTLHRLGFDICDDKPCFMNIIPGVTTVDDALLQLESKGGKYKTTSGHSVYFSLEKLHCKTALVDDSPYVAGIELVPDYLNLEGQITLADFVQLYGEPCVVLASSPHATSPHTVKIAFEYPLIRILCQKVEDDNASISSAFVTHILFAGPQLVGRGMTPNPCGSMNDPESERTAWQGFLSLNEYRRLIWREQQCKRRRA